MQLYIERGGNWVWLTAFNYMLTLLLVVHIWPLLV